MSIGREKMSLDASHASQTPAGGVGSLVHCVPKIVLFEVKCA